jgi:hypothetical protein
VDNVGARKQSGCEILGAEHFIPPYEKLNIDVQLIKTVGFILL